MRTSHDDVMNDLDALVAGDEAAIARHAEHLAGCDECRDARHEATMLAERLRDAGADYVVGAEMAERVLAKLEDRPQASGLRPQASDVRRQTSDVSPRPEPEPKPATPAQNRPKSEARSPKPAAAKPPWLAAAAIVALAAGATGVVLLRKTSSHHGTSAGDSIGHVASTTRAAADHTGGVELEDHGTWRVLARDEQLPAGAHVRTDERTRTSIDLVDGTHLVLDHATTLAFDPAEPRKLRLVTGRILADVAHVDNRPASVTTPTGRIEVVGTRFVATATAALTCIQVLRGQVGLVGATGRDDVRAGEEGSIENGKVTVSPVPQLSHEVEWAELAKPSDKTDETTAGLGALRAYKPGESRDRDWNLALAKHDVKVRIVGPIARTEITETFRNDSAQELEGVYQFPLPPDAQIDGLALDVNGQMVDGAFVDKERGAKIWKGVIDKATPKHQEIARDEIIWVDGSWRDPALLDWKRGGRFELRVFPIPAKGARTIKLAYTQVVTPRGPWRQYVYPLPHSKDGSTVADQMNVDVEIRGAVPGLVRTAGYELQPDPIRTDVNALTLAQPGFVPRGDLVVAYRPTDGDAEVRAWTYTGGAAVAPEDKLTDKKNVGIDLKVVDAQRAVAADTRPTAVLALRPQLPRWTESKPRDYMIVLDASQSMVGERFARAAELALALVEQMDRRDRFSIMTCDSECRSLGDLRSPANAADEAKRWLGGQTAAGATDLVASIRSAREALSDVQRDRWVLYVGDGFASTGFRRVADVERALTDGNAVHLTTIGIGADADVAVLEAAARGGGGSYLAWLPGERIGTAAMAALESTYGSALRGAKIELPAGLADVAPSVLPTLRAGEEVLVAARMTGDVQGDVVVRGTVGGQPFEQRYPLHLTPSSAPGNGFVPRLWATLAIEQRERAGGADDRANIVALSQGYGVMSRETSLLVLESQAMFDAFGVDRHVPAAKWTGEEQLEEVAANGTLPVTKDSDRTAAPAKPMAKAAAKFDDDNLSSAYGGEHSATPVATTVPMPVPPPAPMHHNVDKKPVPPRDRWAGGGGLKYQNPNMFQMRRTWVRVPSVTPYDAVNPAIVKAVGDAERALAKSPDSREKHRALVQALSYAGELDRARDVAGKWLDRDRLDPQALGYQADLLGRAGQRELGLRTLAGLVDLDADRAPLHERMVQAYEHVGRLPQACSHRVALSALAPKDAKTAGAAMRCLRALGHGADADLITRALADDGTRAAAEQIAQTSVETTKLAGDLVVAAHWDRSADLDVSIVTPDGTRVSWMGGRTDLVVTDATSGEREQLAIRSLKRGNYLIEIARGAPSSGTVKGSIEVTVLGMKKTLPFELVGDRVVVGRLSIALEERLEEVQVGAGQMSMQLGGVSDDNTRKVLLARSRDVRQCYLDALSYQPDLKGRIVLTITTGTNGYGNELRTTASPGMEGVAMCTKQTLSSMHVATNGTLRIPLGFSP